MACLAETRPKEVFPLTSFRKRCFAEMVLAGSHHHRWNKLRVISQEELSASWLGFNLKTSLSFLVTDHKLQRSSLTITIADKSP